MKKQDKKMASWQAMKQLLPIIGRYRLLLFISIILAAVSVIFQLYVPIIFGRAIDQIVGPGKVDFPAIGQDLVQILILVIVSAAATWMMGLINNKLTYRTVQDIREKAIRQLQLLPLSYLDQHPSGDIVSRIIADADQLSDGLLLGFSQLFSGLITIVATLALHAQPVCGNYPPGFGLDSFEFHRGPLYCQPVLPDVQKAEPDSGRADQLD